MLQLSALENRNIADHTRQPSLYLKKAPISRRSGEQSKTRKVFVTQAIGVLLLREHMPRDI